MSLILLKRGTAHYDYLEPDNMWYCHEGDEIEPLVAEHNMVVYKHGGERYGAYDGGHMFMSAHMHHIYDAWVMQPHIDMEIRFIDADQKAQVCTGYHAQLDSKFIEDWYPAYGMDKLGIFVIPKGAQYYLGDDNDIISSDIVYLASGEQWDNLFDAEKEFVVNMIPPIE